MKYSYIHTIKALAMLVTVLIAGLVMPEPKYTFVYLIGLLAILQLNYSLSDLINELRNNKK